MIGSKINSFLYNTYWIIWKSVSGSLVQKLSIRRFIEFFYLQWRNFPCFLRLEKWNAFKLGISVTQLFNQFSSVQSLSHVTLFVTPWIAAHQASLSITNSRSSLRLTSIKSVMPSSYLLLCHPLLLLPPIPPSIRVFSNESTLRQSTEVAKVLEFQL